MDQWTSLHPDDNTRARHCARTLRMCIAGSFGFALACASAGTKPQDMSVEGHERAAMVAQEESDQHSDLYDPSQDYASTDCAPDVCLPTWSNPTSAHRDEAARLRRLARQHRKAAQALREAEEAACAGVNERDRDLSPFFHVDDIRSVTVPALDSDEPVTVTFGRVPGLTKESLQTLIDCHLARSASMGHEMPGMDYCPLVPRGVEASVSTEGEALVVSVAVAQGTESRAEVLRRAVKLEEALQ